MRKTQLVLTVLILQALSVLVGCAGDAATTIPDSVTAEQEQQLQEAQKRVDDEERQHRQAAGGRAG